MRMTEVATAEEGSLRKGLLCSYERKAGRNLSLNRSNIALVGTTTYIAARFARKGLPRKIKAPLCDKIPDTCLCSLDLNRRKMLNFIASGCSEIFAILKRGTTTSLGRNNIFNPERCT